jgi:metal-responsive CopG/Arc/MetJ family transcriptional regulator
MSAPLDQRVQLIASKELMIRVDSWRRDLPGLPSRSEAIRRLIEAGLKAKTKLKKR